MKMLQAKLYQMEQEKKAEEVNALKVIRKKSLGEVKFAHTFSRHIPWLKITVQAMKLPRLNKVMDGDIEGFIECLPQVRMEE